MTSRQIGNYRILDYVGGGGFGSVFRAEDLNSPGRIVAIKELHKKHSRSAVIKQRFFQEALAMARLDHPNLPRIYTFGEDNGSYYLVMEFVYGRPLSEEIQHTGPIPEQRAVQIITQVLEAVSYAHKNGVIHRDLKPDNIILTNDNGSPGVKVLDFGIAKMVGGENLTMSGEGFGTPTYMSPERIGGGSDLDRRTDIYSIGIILFEMLAGQVPFATKSTDPLFYWTEMRRLHESEPLPDLSSLGVSPGLQQVFRKAAAKRLEDRYSTADEMLAVLRGKSPTASLILFTAPGQADIYVDNVLRGASDEAGHATIDGLAPGVQNVRVSKAGYGVYNIDVALAVDRPTQLQVQLPANATVAIPRNEPTAPTPSGTNKIENGDDVKTVLVSLQNLPAGGTLVMGSSGPLPIGMDGRATLALTPGVHEVQITDSTGRIQRQTLTVQGANQDSTKTAVLPPPKPTADFTPRPTPPPTAVAYPPQPPPTANAYTPQPVAGGQMMGGYPPPTKTWSPPPSGPPPMGPPQSAPGSDSGAKWLAAAISLFLLVGLAIAAYFVIRGPGRGPTRLSAADLTPTPTPRDIGAGQLPQYTPPAVPTPEPSLGISLEPTPYPSFEPTPYPSPSPSRSPQTKPTPKPEPSKGDIIGEEPRPERTPRQIQIPTPTPPPRPSPTRAIQEPLGDACLVVAVVGSGGRLRPGFAITCSELTGTGHPNSYGGRTGPAGRWRQCGMTPGHRVIVQVYDELGNARAGRQQVLSPGLNLIEVRVE